MAPMVRLTALVSGRVQGVGFRFWVQYRAAELGLPGRAFNLPDGRVEVIVEGRREACQAMLDRLTGPATPGHVTSVTPRWGSAEGLSGFRIG